MVPSVCVWGMNVSGCVRRVRHIFSRLFTVDALARLDFFCSLVYTFCSMLHQRDVSAGVTQETV